MSEQPKTGDSSRHLLHQIENEWDSPETGPGTANDLHTELDASTQPLVQTPDPPSVSGRHVDDLDGGWNDDHDDPDHPDARLDKVAYAAARKAREERMEAKRQRKRLKVEEVKSRHKARVDAQKQQQKQKPKTKKSLPHREPAKAQGPTKNERRATVKPARARAGDDGISLNATHDDMVDVSRSRKPRLNRLPKDSMLSTTNQRMLAVAVIVFVSAAIFAAVITR